MRINLNSYISLISDLVNDKISAKCFEYAYLKLFKEEKGKRSESEFRVLNTLFLDVDEFCNDPELIDEHDIGEEELKRRCEVAIEGLKKIEAE